MAWYGMGWEKEENSEKTCKPKAGIRKLRGDASRHRMYRSLRKAKRKKGR